MPDCVVIRPYIETDFESFRAYIDTVARERKFFGMVEAPAREKLLKLIAKIKRDGMPQFVAVDGERVVGHVDLNAHEREGFRHNAQLGMGLLPEFRGQGLGERLLELAIAGGRAAGLQRLELAVYASNAAAIALYEKSGFVREGVQRKARFLDGRHDDVILMVYFT
jgi:RimJ/RimL family protein N-acetyltransferase